MNEEQKETFKKIISMKSDELNSEMNSLKENMSQKIEKLLSESSDSAFVNKLNEVKRNISESETNKFNYYRLIELSKNLD